MPEVSFESETNCFNDFTEQLFKWGLKLIPDLNYKNKQFDIITTSDELKNYSSKMNSYFIVDDSWDWKISMGFTNNIHMGPIYYIEQSCSGPFISLFTVKKSNNLQTGEIAYRNKFWDEDINFELYAPMELKQVYKRITSLIKSSKNSYIDGKRKIWKLEYNFNENDI